MVNSDVNHVQVRIPAEKLNPFLDELANLGEVETRNVYSYDVTEEYADIDLRLDNARKSRERYLELLKNAQNVTEVLAVERELERLNVEVERLEGRKRSYDTQIQYSSVDVYFKEKVRPGPIGYVFVGIYKVIKFLFVRN
jgi:hypothetical protein